MNIEMDMFCEVLDRYVTEISYNRAFNEKATEARNETSEAERKLKSYHNEQVAWIRLLAACKAVVDEQG